MRKQIEVTHKYEETFCDKCGDQITTRFNLDACIICGIELCMKCQKATGAHNIEASLHLPWIKRYLISNEHTSYNWEVVRRYLINNPPTLHSKQKQNENRLIHIVKGIKEIDL